MPDTSYLLIPGAGGDGWYWHLVVEELGRRSVEAVAVDPGADEAAGFAEYADVAVVAAGDRGRLIVVAQSMGAYVGPMLCERLPVALRLSAQPARGAGRCSTPPVNFTTTSSPRSDPIPSTISDISHGSAGG